MLLRCCLISAVMTLAPAVYSAPPQSAGVFTFNLPAPVSYDEETRTTSTVVGADIEAGDEVRTVKTTFKVESETDGYRITAHPRSFEITRGGKAVKDSAMEAIQSTEIVYHVSPDGTLKSVDGYAGVLPAVLKVSPKNAAKALTPILNERALVTREQAQWKARIGGLLGIPVTKNSVAVGEGVFPFPNGTLAKYHVVSLVDGPAKLDDRDLVKVRVLFTSDASEIQKRVNDMARDQVQGVPRPAPIPVPPGFSVSGQGERLIDPRTMLTYSEKMTREVRFSISSGKDSLVPLLVHEVTERKITKMASGVK